MYAKFMPPLRSLDGTSTSIVELLLEFGFFKVNITNTNALTAISNSGTGTTSASKPPNPSVTLEQVTTMISEVKSEMKELK